MRSMDCVNAQIDNAVKELLNLQHGNIHSKVHIRDTFDVRLLLQVCRSIHTEMFSTNSLAASCGFLGFLFVLLHTVWGPASILQLYIVRAEWVPYLELALRDTQAVFAARAQIAAVFRRSAKQLASLAATGGFLVKGIRCNASHTGISVAMKFTSASVTWDKVQSFAHACGAVLTCAVSDFIDNYKSFLAAGKHVFKGDWNENGYNSAHAGRTLVQLRISYGRRPPDDEPDIARRWWQMIWKMTDCPRQWLENRNLKSYENGAAFCTMFGKLNGERMLLHDLVCSACEAECLDQQPESKTLLASCRFLPLDHGDGQAVLSRCGVRWPVTLAKVKGALWGVREMSAAVLAYNNHIMQAKRMKPLGRTLDAGTLAALGWKPVVPVVPDDLHKSSKSKPARRILRTTRAAKQIKPLNKMSKSARQRSVARGRKARPRGPAPSSKWWKRPLNRMTKKQRILYKSMQEY